MVVSRKTSLFLVIVVAVMAWAASAALAASSASITFDFVSEPGDLADGPVFNITASGIVDDGSGCDFVVVVMVDATGTPSDVDTICLNLVSGQGGSDGDYGSMNSGYLPVAGPATYAVFDIDAADIAALSGTGDSEQAYFDYVVANGTFLTEGYVDVPGLTSGTPYSFVAVAAASGTCTLPLPDGSVVGDLPLGAQVFYAPGKESPGIVLNPGTYHVVGQDESETYYKLHVACQFLWVLKTTMQPSSQAPQNGAPLPTRIVS